MSNIENAPPMPASEVLAPLPDYWTPVAKTGAQYDSIRSGLDKVIRTKFRLKGVNGSLEIPFKFKDNVAIPYVSPIHLLLDGYTYSKSPMKSIISAILESVSILENSHFYQSNETQTKFMYQGVQVVLAHKTLNGSIVRSSDYDRTSHSHYMSYDGLGKLWDIILRSFNFRLDDNYALNYDLKTAEGEVYKSFVLQGDFSLVLNLLGLSSYMDAFYSPLESLSRLVQLLCFSSVISKSNLFIDAGNEYIGPEDYFGCELFKMVVQNIIQTNTPLFTNSNKKTPDAISKHQLKILESSQPRIIKNIAIAQEEYQVNKIMSSKFNDGLITAVTGYKNGRDIKSFYKSFEKSVSETDDFTFFVMSSSEDTIRNRVQEFHNSNKPSQP